jgi:signal transduction histidine kinase
MGSSAQLLSLLKDMESGQHGYVITRDSDFLEPYDQAKDMVRAQTDSLKKLLTDDEQKANFLKERIIALVDDKCKDLEHTIYLANNFGKDSAEKKVNTKVGKAYMDTLRVLIDNLIQRERASLAQQNEDLERNTRIEDVVRFFAFSLIGATSFAAIFAVATRQRRINALIERLEKTNETLELRVTQRTAELSSANRAKDHFLGIASHDLKVPIAGVLGLIGLMKKDNSGRSKSDVEYLDYIEDSCKNMQGLISNLLDINRIDRGETHIEKEAINVGDLLNSLKQVFSFQAEKKGITLKIATATGTLSTDREALLRILENILSNAIKFSPQGKTVKVNVTRQDGMIRFEVMDEGPGISPEEIPDLFKRFKKHSNKPTGGEGSTGLGLSIAKELTVLLGGNISMTSQVGNGSVFIITLPQQ